MSVVDQQVDPEPEWTECHVHHRVYPISGTCQSCQLDIVDEYADHATAKGDA